MGARELYEYLDGFSNVSFNDIFHQIALEWSQNQISATVETLNSLIETEYFVKPSIFNFYSNSTLAGGPEPCSSPFCRLNNVDNLARFAALYADKILIPSPIEDHYFALTQGKQIDSFSFASSILVLLKIKPLVISHIIGFFPSHICLCENCLKKITTKELELNAQLDNILSYYSNDVINTAHCTLKRDPVTRIAYFQISNIEKYGYHDATDVLALEETPEVSQLLLNSNNEEIQLSPTQMVNCDIPLHILSNSLNDIFKTQILTKIGEGTYLTDRPFEAQIIDSLRIDPKGSFNKSAVSTSISSSLFHEIPIINNATLESIVNLRNSNGESFEVYRDSINKYLKADNHIDDEVINNLQKSIIEPEVHKMQNSINVNKKILKRNTIRNITITGMGICIGLFSGLLPLDYAPVVSMIGGIPTIGNMVSDFQSAYSDQVIQDNSYYFLWKLQKKQEVL